MGGLFFDLAIIFATNLVDVKKYGRMQVYAVVSLNGRPETTYTTPVDYVRGGSLCWNVRTPYNRCFQAVKRGDLPLNIKLHPSSFSGNSYYVAGLLVPLKRLFDERNRHNNQHTYAKYFVNWVNPHGRFGVLNFSYRFHETPTVIQIVNGVPSGRRQNLAQTLVKRVAVSSLTAAAVAALESFLPG
ncbi:OLC1v1016709C1 [Oldenlandia corymbosa var. corymbosa]|uniref:OLC1v1016709C1 n=1 Tax=Oldenlandia corymbosa var. corymbosa TaxID=529605 RepID=A0AAV1E7S4_OLDCO|nr:OLC1v1016709C1 [Oldenlandia corymbosa var. corymbosa]